MAEEVKVVVEAEDRASGVIGGISGSLGKFGLVIGTITGAVAGMVKIANDVAQFNKSIAQAGANVQASTETLEQFRKVAIEATRDTMFSAEDAAGALKFLAGGTISAEEAMKALDDTVKFATATGFDNLNEAVLAVSDAMVLFKIRGDDVGRATDVLTRASQISFATIQELTDAFQQAAPAAAQAGVAFEETVGILGALADAGFRGMEGGVGLKRALEQLALPDTQEKLAVLGVSVKDASGEFIGFLGVLEQLEAKTQGMTGLEKQAFLADIFGQVAGPKMAALLNMGSEAVKDYSDRLYEAQGATDAAAASINEALNPVQQLNNRWFEFKTKIAPGITAILDSWVQTIDDTSAAIRFLTKTIATDFKSSWDTLQMIGNFIVEKFNQITSAAERMRTAISGAVSGAVGKVKGLLGFSAGGVVPGPLGAPQLAVVHGGERVIPNSGLRAEGGGGSGIVVNITGNTISSEMDLKDIAQRVGEEMVRVLKFNTKI